MQTHIHTVHACLAVSCHLHLWQNDRDLLGATAVVFSYHNDDTKAVNGGWRLSHTQSVQLPLLNLRCQPLGGFSCGGMQCLAYAGYRMVYSSEAKLQL